MKELTLAEKNDMIDWMVEKSLERPQFSVGALCFSYSMNGGEYIGTKQFSKIFPELVNFHFREQSERILYLLLVREFINMKR